MSFFSQLSPLIKTGLGIFLATLLFFAGYQLGGDHSSSQNELSVLLKSAPQEYDSPADIISASIIIPRSSFPIIKNGDTLAVKKEEFAVFEIGEEFENVPITNVFPESQKNLSVFARQSKQVQKDGKVIPSGTFEMFVLPQSPYANSFQNYQQFTNFSTKYIYYAYSSANIKIPFIISPVTPSPTPSNTLDICAFTVSTGEITRPCSMAPSKYSVVRKCDNAMCTKNSPQPTPRF
ncbi:MAG: hypothetical protein WCJ84_04325 [Candidatus Peregrinibacteria bacterium]